VKIEVAAERCVNVLLDLIGTRVSYVVQEAVVVMKVGGLVLSIQG
jgi:AP-1 complex subunit beta-1